MTRVGFSEIPYLKEFLENHLNKEVKKYSLRYFTKPGEHYGSIMQGLTVELEDENENSVIESENRKIELVAKTAVQNEFLKGCFQPHITVIKENEFYANIIPAMKKFEDEKNFPDEHRVNVFFDYIGSRSSLDSSARIADENALLVLENAKANGYENGNRFEGFNAKITFKVMEGLARMHALAIAVRLQHANVFNEKFRPFLTPIDLNASTGTNVSFNSASKDLIAAGFDDEVIMKFKSHFDTCVKLSHVTTVLDVDSPYTTIVHRDLWTNNIMTKRTDDNDLMIKIYDFQLYFYHSFVLDLIFFWFTSVQPDELYEHFHSFFKRYHEVFVETLKDGECQLENYSFERMWDEVKDKAKLEILHTLFMIKLCTFQIDDSVDLDKVDSNDFMDQVKPSPNYVKQVKNMYRIFDENGFF